MGVHLDDYKAQPRPPFGVVGGRRRGDRPHLCVRQPAWLSSPSTTPSSSPSRSPPSIAVGGRFVPRMGYGWNRDRGSRPWRGPSANDAPWPVRRSCACRRCGRRTRPSSTGPTWSCRCRSRGPSRCSSRASAPSGRRGGPVLFAAIAEYADGWMPIGGAGIGSALDEAARRVHGGGTRSRHPRGRPLRHVPDEGKLAALRVDRFAPRFHRLGLTPWRVASGPARDGAGCPVW